MDCHDEIGRRLDEGHRVERPSLVEVAALAWVGNTEKRPISAILLQFITDSMYAMRTCEHAPNLIKSE